jgi:hypothetical protein
MTPTLEKNEFKMKKAERADVADDVAADVATDVADDVAADVAADVADDVAADIPLNFCCFASTPKPSIKHQVEEKDDEEEKSFSSIRF